MPTCDSMQIVLFNPQNNPTEAYYYPRFTDEETEAQTQPVACPESRSRSRPRPSDLSATLPFVKKMRLRSEKGARAGGSVARQGHEALRQGDSASKRAQTPTGPLRPLSPSVSGQTPQHLGRSVYHQVVPKRKEVPFQRDNLTKERHCSVVPKQADQRQPENLI